MSFLCRVLGLLLPTKLVVYLARVEYRSDANRRIISLCLIEKPMLPRIDLTGFRRTFYGVCDGKLAELVDELQIPKTTSVDLSRRRCWARTLTAGMTATWESTRDPATSFMNPKRAVITLDRIEAYPLSAQWAWASCCYCFHNSWQDQGFRFTHVDFKFTHVELSLSFLRSLKSIAILPSWDVNSQLGLSLQMRSSEKKPFGQSSLGTFWAIVQLKWQ